MVQALRRKRQPRGLAFVPNAGLEREYARRLKQMVDGMHASVVYWLRSAYRKDEPNQMAMDSIGNLQATLKKLSKQWQQNFDDTAKDLATFFASRIDQQTMARFRSILRKGGYSVKFRMTQAMRDVMKATIQEQVSLIKSIPQQYLKDVQGAVMRSVQTGRNLQELTKELTKYHGITRRRAEFIALDQNNKVTSAMTHARQASLGIYTAEWMHSHAGKEPRPTHVAMNGKRYDIRKGMWDPAVKKYIFPGELPRCRCSSRPIIPGVNT